MTIGRMIRVLAKTFRVGHVPLRPFHNITNQILGVFKTNSGNI
jgi:hypothetical protein